MKKKGLKRKIDKAFNKTIRDRGSCERCHKTETLQAAHIFSRANMNIRWDYDNVLCLCAGCHFWAHKNPTLFGEWVVAHLGKERYNDLVEKASKIRKWSLLEMQVFLETFNF